MRGQHQTAGTSITAFYALGPKLGQQQQAIVAYLAKHCHRDFTRAELAHCMGYRVASVCGRTNELVKLFMVSEGPRRRCAITGSNAHPLRLAPAQMDLVL
jgi:hypothetical protein